MKKLIATLLSVCSVFVLSLSAALPVGADAVVQTTPCAPGEHKVYRDIFTFKNDPEYPFREEDGTYHSAPYQYYSELTAMWAIIEDGTLTIDFYAPLDDRDFHATITHNSRTVAQSDPHDWKSITLSVKANDEVILRYYCYGPDKGTCIFRASGTVLVAAEEVKPTCTKGVVCDLCGTVVKEAAHTYDDIVDADCNVCDETRTVTYTGWLSQNGTWYYYQNGVKLKNTWVQDSVGWCYLGRDGAIATNTWAKDSVGWCYVGADGYCVTNQWRKDSVGWCYLGVDGRMVTNRWVMDSVGWCYVGADGYCVTNNWAKDSNGWCYLGADGRMLTDSWAKDSNGWCYVGSDGYCVTETWVKDSVGWRYLNKNGNVAKGAWVKTNDKWYFVDSYGYMVTGKQYVGGKAYYFDIVTGELIE
ncbi:MAG: N-acetylmuramoyl-L-alanine amidase family protein [Clostridia bacterium]|nr:N-acetylmuramoyl-L-alanine amidase family protein [Clostridia bacterium]